MSGTPPWRDGEPPVPCPKGCGHRVHWNPCETAETPKMTTSSGEKYSQSEAKPSAGNATPDTVTPLPPGAGDLIERLKAYDGFEGGHSDAAQGTAYELIAEAAAFIQQSEASRTQAEGSLQATITRLAREVTAAEARASQAEGEVERIRKLDTRAFANWQREREKLWKLRDEHCAARLAAEARATLAEGALQPFAATGALLDAKPKDDACWAGQTPAPPITFGHLRAASSLLSSLSVGGE